ncbi:hypothetical protein EV672_107223 [Aquabacterium commune]|uniref:Uncharacterized protein n=1 Tax=Aquabacterium commune TaxID=70586 RepID=A0A4R6R7Q3_9BURK|nr:hypothetical protein EV672_107223 [Aquabacterium commune]
MHELWVIERFGLAMLDSRAEARLSGPRFSQNYNSNPPYFGVALEYEVAPQTKLTAAADFTNVKVGNKPARFDCSASAGKLTSDRFRSDPYPWPIEATHNPQEFL